MTTSTLLTRLTAVVGDRLIATPSELLVYECDGFTIEKNRPDVVVFATSSEEVAQIVRICNELNVPFLPRGAGTSLAGGCLPVGGGVVISLVRMKRILEVDYRNRYAVVEPGVVNLWLTNHLKAQGYHFAPDPSSQGACTIGGNVATNSGGPHTLKYGVTVNHVLGVEMVLPDGQIVQTGGPTEDNPGYDLTGVLVGSEGTMGVVTKIWVRITRNPEAYRTLLGVFETVDAATNTISELIGAGIIPAALEMLDAPILKAVEAAFHFGFPLDAGAVLIMEVDGLDAGLEVDAERIVDIAMRNGAREVRRANTDAERLLLWKSRKQAFGAVGRLAPSYCTQDGVVPRTKLPHILREIRRIGEKHQISICNVFHAGDGNIHPILLFDERDADQVQRVLLASHEILEECINVGGSVTGEHGIGVEKISFMSKLFTPEDLGMMVRLRAAFNPEGRCSPAQDAADGRRLHRAEQGRAKGGVMRLISQLPTVIMFLLVPFGLVLLSGSGPWLGRRVVKGIPARIAGLFLLSPYPLTFGVADGCIFIDSDEMRQWIGAHLQLAGLLLEYGCLGLCVTIALSIVSVFARTVQPYAHYRSVLESAAGEKWEGTAVQELRDGEDQPHQ